MYMMRVTPGREGVDIFSLNTRARGHSRDSSDLSLSVRAGDNRVTVHGV